MKKFLSVMLIAVIAVSSVFAMSGYIGASSGYGFHFEGKDEVKNTNTYFPVSVDGATFFGKNNFQFGLSYGAEIIQLPFQSNGPAGTKYDLKPLENYRWTLAPYAGLGFQYKFSKSVGIAGSVNATYNWGSVKDDTSKYIPSYIGELMSKLDPNADVKYHILGMMGNLYLNMNLGPVSIRLGGYMEGPIGLWAKGQALGFEKTSDMQNIMGPFNVVPFAGIGFAY